MKKTPLFLATVCLFLTGCGPKTPDKSLILWEQPSPALAALNHASEKPGLQASNILPTGSMEPYLTGGDWIVIDLNFSYDSLKVADLVSYQARWTPKGSPPTAHMAAAKLGDEWIMLGINNPVYERDSNMRMGRAEYRGKVVQVYTRRPKP